MKDIAIFENNLPSVMVDTQQIDEVLKKYPELSFDSEKNTLEGELNCKDLDSYHVKIDITPFFASPQRFPFVIEEGRVPKTVQRHIYPQSGTLCFTSPTNERISLNTKEITTLLQFVDDVLVIYLLNNSHYEEVGEYKFGEYSHNLIDATFESYFDILGLENNFENKRIVVLMFFNFNIINLTFKRITPNEKCFCESGKKIKKCYNHFEIYKKIKRIDKRILIIDWNLIIEYAFTYALIGINQKNNLNNLHRNRRD